MLYLGLQTEKRKNLSDLITWSSNLRETNGMVALKYRESQAADDIDPAVCQDVEKLLLAEAGVNYNKMD